MELERRLAKVARYHLALFLLPVLSLLYYGWWTAPDLDQRPDNPLGAAPMSRRGDILDRNGKPLARSEEDQRVYPLGPDAGSLVGYHLRGRNQSGLEAYLQTTLSPPPPPKSLWGALKRDKLGARGEQLLKGPDITLTIDSELQKQLYRLFGSRSGAMVVADWKSGEILAAVSRPTFDPNRIGETWQELRSDPRSPFIERVGGGLYPVTDLSGGDLIPEDRVQGHPWFVDNPYPRYPGASGAITVESRQLVSPLMLLELAAGASKPCVPHLIGVGLEGAEGSPRPQSYLPTLVPNSVHHGFSLIRLPGPKFRESPAFDVVLGRSQESGEGRVFAIVVEEHSTGASKLAQDAAAILSLKSPQRSLPR